VEAIIRLQIQKTCWLEFRGQSAPGQLAWQNHKRITEIYSPWIIFRFQIQIDSGSVPVRFLFGLVRFLFGSASVRLLPRCVHDFWPSPWAPLFWVFVCTVTRAWISFTSICNGSRRHTWAQTCDRPNPRSVMHISAMVMA